jgi:hypothetical protein
MVELVMAWPSAVTSERALNNDDSPVPLMTVESVTLDSPSGPVALIEVPRTKGEKGTPKL